jgi:hypothetical protein
MTDPPLVAEAIVDGMQRAPCQRHQPLPQHPQGFCELKESGQKDEGRRAKKSLSLRAMTRFPRGLAAPGEIDAFLESLRNVSLLKKDFPQVKLRGMESREPHRVRPYGTASLDLEIEGTYPQLKAFVEWIEHSDRLLRVDGVRFERSSKSLLMKILILGLMPSRLDLRLGSACLPAPGPGHHHGRRDSRPGDSADLPAGGVDGAHGLVHAAHE